MVSEDLSCTVGTARSVDCWQSTEHGLPRAQVPKKGHQQRSAQGTSTAGQLLMAGRGAHPILHGYVIPSAPPVGMHRSPPIRPYSRACNADIRTLGVLARPRMARLVFSVADCMPCVEVRPAFRSRGHPVELAQMLPPSAPERLKESLRGRPTFTQLAASLHQGFTERWKPI